MPKLTRTFIKAAFIYLILALVTGVLLAYPDGSPIPGLFAPYLHMLTFGWLTQFIFGIAIWLLPKFSRERPRGYEWPGWVTFVSLNVGLILRIIFEPLVANSPLPLASGMLVGAAVFQWLAGITFLLNAWPRVKEK